MNRREQRRVMVLTQVVSGAVTAAGASERLALSERQTKRLLPGPRRWSWAVVEVQERLDGSLAVYCTACGFGACWAAIMAEERMVTEGRPPTSSECGGEGYPRRAWIVSEAKRTFGWNIETTRYGGE